MEKRDSTPLRTAEVSELTDTFVLQELLDLVEEAGPDERRILLYIARRIVAMGQRCYGPIDIKNDPRDMLKELNEELADALFYVSVATLKKELGR